MYRTAAVALVAALALGVASCGGTSGASGPKLTQAQMVRQLDEICSQVREATEAAMKASARSSQAPDARLRAAYISGQRLFVSKLKKVNPPDAAQRDLTAFQQGVARRLALTQRTQGSTSVQHEQTAIFDRLDAIAHRYGLEGCV